MSSKLGKIQTETKSRRPKWSIIGHCFLICVISGKPDQIARPVGPTIEQKYTVSAILLLQYCTVL